MIRARHAVILLLPALFFVHCGKGIREEVGPADAKKKVMIAALSSEYKDRVVRGLVDKYKVRSRVTVVPIDRLNSIDTRKYDALVIVDALMAWQMFNTRTRWFIGGIRDPEELKKIVLFFTAGKPSERYRVMGVDCITGASVMSEEAEVIKKLSERIDRVIHEK